VRHGPPRPKAKLLIKLGLALIVGQVEVVLRGRWTGRQRRAAVRSKKLREANSSGDLLPVLKSWDILALKASLGPASRGASVFFLLLESVIQGFSSVKRILFARVAGGRILRKLIKRIPRFG